MKKLASAFAAVILLVCHAAAAPAELTPRSVVILANSDDPDSVPIAEHYAQVRGVPPENIVALRMPLGETITWREFIDSIWQPLQDELVRRQWIDGTPTSLTDELGRRKYLIAGHRIGALVVCRGVPLRISHDPGLYREVPPLTVNAQFRTNAGAVDSELSLLPLTDYPINAFIPNPLYRNEHPSEFDCARVVRVSRLDGPTAKDALELVDNAVLAEKSGLMGRAYVDLGGPHANGDGWLSATAESIRKLGFDLTVDHAPATMGVTARFDAPALYFGWYAADFNGPFLLPGFRFPPGAIALHIFSFSAHTLRSATRGWSGPFVAHGVTATVGNVYEPYLELTHRPDLLFTALARGQTLVEAAYYALPDLSWEAIVIGDPLYRPFAVDLAGQAARLATLPPDLGDYVVMRQANLQAMAGNATEAIRLLEARFVTHPGLPVILALARLQLAAGDKRAAAIVLHSATDLATFAPMDWEVAHEVAAEMVQAGDFADAVTVDTRLFDRADLERAIRLPWLADARQAALSAHDPEASKAFKAEIDRLVSEVLSAKSP